MKKLTRLKWFISGMLVVLVLEVATIAILWGTSNRPLDPPPEDVDVSLPWGAIDLQAIQTDRDSTMHRSIADSIRAEGPEQFDPDGDGIRTYDLLALSGGGSRGAFGAGFLSGWTDSGKRPLFKIVTGVSVGALQATSAFLGPEYDYVLRETFTGLDTEDIYTKRFVLKGILSDALYDTAPLKQVIDRYVTAEVLQAVAKAHGQGRRLFIGTTNMDTGAFVIWDMGKIASSDRPDALEHYRNILLASSAVQVAFPPVYFDVEAGGKKYSEMHADGATYAQVFFRGFLLDFDDALEDVGITTDHVEARLYILINGWLADVPIRKNVTPRAMSIGSATIGHLLQIRANASLYRMYVLAARYDIDFNMAVIPDDHPKLAMTDFNRAATGRLFDRGYELANKGYAWIKAPPGLDVDELVTPKTGATLGKDTPGATGQRK